MKYELIIFDCDGVLVDSEPIYHGILSEMLNEIGLPFTLEESMQTFAGRPDAAVEAIIEERLGRPVPFNFFKEHHERAYAMFRRDLEPVPGIVEVLSTLMVPTCVASSGEHERMQTTLGKTGLLPKFEGRLFSATEVEYGKPAPDLFLYAANKMDARPKNCAVIEDAIPGVQAGISAGMTVFGFAAHADPKAMDDAGARVFLDMSELTSLLEE
jgi:phosphoglycolate phosphatase